MPETADSWDYLIVTASSPRQAAGYRSLLDVRRRFGMLSRVGEVLVVPDPGGRRVGSGGSTLFCLLEVLRREMPPGAQADPLARREALGRLRVLILHAGGDSRRLPAYGPCGKLFVPVPGRNDSALPHTLLDCQVPVYLSLPAPPGGGQVVVAAGDVLLDFRPESVVLAAEGITALAAYGGTGQGRHHGVFCTGSGRAVTRYLQKPDEDEQHAQNAVDRYGRVLLDLGCLSFTGSAAADLLEVAQPATENGQLKLTGPVGDAILSDGLDIYREIGCALGTGTTPDQHRQAARAAGASAPDEVLEMLYRHLHATPLSVCPLPQCRLTHAGTTSELLQSGLDLMRAGARATGPRARVELNNALGPSSALGGGPAWIEGCRIDAELTLGGRNVLVGADADTPAELGEGVCLDVLPGRDEQGQPVCFARWYGVDDNFKLGPDDEAATFGALPLNDWMAAADVTAEDLWPTEPDPDKRTLWTARIFPAVSTPADAWAWGWLHDPRTADDAGMQAWRDARRYSLAEMHDLADDERFHERRYRIRVAGVAENLRWLFGPQSELSAGELAFLLRRSDRPGELAAAALEEAFWHQANAEQLPPEQAFVFSRVAHALGSTVQELADQEDQPLGELLEGLDEGTDAPAAAWAEHLGLTPAPDRPAGPWAQGLKDAAFAHLQGAVLASAARWPVPPKRTLRTDEIVWGQAPARFDLAGGWTDTPPYALEHGGAVVNAAVDLNGQPPIHCYARPIAEPVLRVASVDLGQRVEIRTLDELLDFQVATGPFSLAKAALAFSGLSPLSAAWPEGIELDEILRRFGGGLELTTLAAIPKGSGLGTSSIVAAVLLATVQRTMGRLLGGRDLFHAVLRVEQALTTGGGWQDQVGGVIDGVKLISAEAGLVPDIRAHHLPTAALDPAANGGCTLLYYTGVTRLAKNILQNVVGRYLDRDRGTVQTLRRIAALAPRVAEALSARDLAALGHGVREAWELNKQLDPDSTNPAIEQLLARIEPHAHGYKLLGAGGGGFCLVIARSPEHAAALRAELAAEPPNELARFFDVGLSDTGLSVTVC